MSIHDLSPSVGGDNCVPVTAAGTQAPKQQSLQCFSVASSEMDTIALDTFSHAFRTSLHVPILQASNSNASQLETSCSLSGLSQVMP